MLVNQSQVKKVLDMKLALKTVEQAFRSYGLGRVELPAKVYLTFPKGDLRAMPAYIKDMNIAGIKSVNVHPDNRKLGLPTVMAVVILVNPETGETMALLDGTYLTAMRTGAVGGVAAKYLSKKNSSVAGFIGAGMQAWAQFQALMLVRKIKKIKVWSRTAKGCKRFCAAVKKKYKQVEIEEYRNPRDACKDVDILITTTPSRKPIVKASWISPGTHINAVGADAAGKQELENALTKKANIVIDQWEQCSHSGEINVPVSRGLVKKKDIYAELGQICAGKKKGRTNDKDITLFDSTGLAIQDISCGYVVYKKLKKGKEFDFTL